MCHTSRKHIKYQIISMMSLFLLVVAAAQTTIADPVAVELAERIAQDPGNPPATTTTTTTTSTTSTTTTTLLTTIPPCPDSIVGATPTSGPSNDGTPREYDYWKYDYDVADLCPIAAPGESNRIYCFENPYVNLLLPDLVEQQMSFDYIQQPYSGNFDRVIASGTNYTNTCFICGCFRDIGCFPPGVKITMADGSLRRIEDVRAGDLVRNAKTGAPVKVRQVIEGPEPLPLIRFGFNGTTVTTSQAHPVLTAAGLKPANELKTGDTVFDAQGKPHTLTILETLPLEEGQRVINVDLETASSDADKRLLVSDGIITGDIVLQGLLKKQK